MQNLLSYIKKNKIETITILLITILAAILRITCLLNFGELWYDELFSWAFAARDTLYSTVVDAVREDIHMPLYFVLLHFWLKLVGKYNIDGMRTLSLLLSFPLIPCSYYLIKNIFNKYAAYFSIIYLTINTFCIYYSNEVRFYSLTLTLSFLIACFFVKMLENFDKKYIIAFIIAASLQFYTFSITPLLIFIYFIVGLIYVLIKKKDKIKNYMIVALILFVISSPAIFFTVLNAITMKNALTYYPLDNYPFDGRMIFDLLENFFSMRNAQIWENNTVFFTEMFDNIYSFPYFAFVFLPILLALFAIGKALLSKNDKLYLFFLPSLIFLVVLFSLAAGHIVVSQTRYLNIILPVFLCSVCYGFSSFKNEIISISLYVTFIFLNLMNLVFNDRSVFNLHRLELNELNTVFDEIVQIRDDDYLISPVLAVKVEFYAKKGKHIPFSAEGAFVLKDNKSKEMYFGEDYKKLKRDNLKKYMMDYIMQDRPHPHFEQYLYENYIKNLKPNERIVFMSFYGDHILPPKNIGINKESYADYNLPGLLFSKSARDIYLILNKNLKEVNRYHSNAGHITIIFEKE